MGDSSLSSGTCGSGVERYSHYTGPSLSSSGEGQRESNPFEEVVIPSCSCYHVVSRPGLSWLLELYQYANKHLPARDSDKRPSCTFWLWQGPGPGWGGDESGTGGFLIGNHSHCCFFAAIIARLLPIASNTFARIFVSLADRPSEIIMDIAAASITRSLPGEHCGTASPPPHMICKWHEKGQQSRGSNGQHQSTG